MNLDLEKALGNKKSNSRQPVLYGPPVSVRVRVKARPSRVRVRVRVNVSGFGYCFK